MLFFIISLVVDGKGKKYIAKASHFTATITRKKREDMCAPEERKKFRGGTDTIIYVDTSIRVFSSGIKMTNREG